MDEGREIIDLPLYLRRFHFNPYCVWYDYLNPSHTGFHVDISTNLLNNHGESTVKSVRSIAPEVHKLRVIKSEAEIRLMRMSASIAAQSFQEVLKRGRPGMSELEIGARMEYECKQRGAERMAYPPVVGAGNRATILHYLANSHIASDGDLVLMDAGCEYHGYASDITRTWPINGRFTKAQRQLYEAVHRVQTSCIQCVKPGITLNQVNNTAEILLADELEKLNVVKKSIFSGQTKQAVHLLFPHHIGHYLGLDTHDTPTISRDTPLQPGMVITIEPGVYFAKQSSQLPEKFKGVGIRIEDDVLVTENGCEVLTSDISASVDEVERLLASY
jgi:Xaa-Pro aminopeptidase